MNQNNSIIAWKVYFHRSRDDTMSDIFKFVFNIITKFHASFRTKMVKISEHDVRKRRGGLLLYCQSPSGEIVPHTGRARKCAKRFSGKTGVSPSVLNSSNYGISSLLATANFYKLLRIICNLIHDFIRVKFLAYVQSLKKNTCCFHFPLFVSVLFLRTKLHSRCTSLHYDICKEKASFNPFY